MSASGRLLAASFLLAAAHAPACAVFIAQEMDAVDTEPLFDSEYFLDLLGFAPPLDWQWDWLASSGGYLANGASLDRSDLLWEADLRFSRKLGERFGFRYDLRRRGDKDLDSLHQWLSMEARTWRGLTLGVFGEPEFAKENADMGVLARWEAGPWTLAASRNAVDFNFNERGRTTQSYPRKPYTYEFAASRRSGPDRVSAACELDAPLERAVPASNRLYAYRRTRAALRWDRVPAPGGRGWSAGYSIDLKRESDAFVPDPSAQSLSSRRAVHELSLAGTVPINGRDSLEGGGRFLKRSAHVESPNAPLESSEHRRWELAPYARWRRTLAPWAVSELGVFLSYGEIRRRFPSDPSRGSAEKPLEAKLGAGIDLLSGRSGRVGLYAHFDLDDLGRHLWDGGNIRAMFLF